MDIVLPSSLVRQVSSNSICPTIKCTCPSNKSTCPSIKSTCPTIKCTCPSMNIAIYLCTVIASLWFSMDHHQTSLMPFWLLTDDMDIAYVWPPDGADHSSYPWGSAFQSSPSCCTRSSLTLLRHASSLACLSSTSSSSSYAHQFRYIFISYLFLTSLCHRHTST